MFADRIDAGARLAERLEHLRGDDLIVVGLPRGGVPVAYQVARRLGAPLDVIIVRKLGVPLQPELAMGAIGEDGVRVLSDEVITRIGVGEPEIVEVEKRERVELERRAQRYREGRDRTPVDGRVVVVVDDGIATGATARAACQVARRHGASRVILAAPVAPRDWSGRLAGAADEYVAVETPDEFWAIGEFYRDFRPTGDDEVVGYLDRSRDELALARWSSLHDAECVGHVHGGDPPGQQEGGQRYDGHTRDDGHGDRGERDVDVDADIGQRSRGQ